jgi:benzylsuccinate CoA-transferase BbsF subunit
MWNESTHGNIKDPQPTLPLEGLRVVEFTTGIVGPTLGRFLAEFGAETIKVETSKRPDFSRGPAPHAINKGISFSDNSRSKKGFQLNVSSPEGHEIALRLIKISDIIVENFSAGVMQRLGLDYPSVAAVNPSVIMISLQGLGATERHSVTFGQNIPPMIGLTYLWNHPGASKPVGSELFYPDYYAGIHGACAVLAALDYRRRTGVGQYIDAAQAEAAAALLGPYYLDAAVNGRSIRPSGNRVSYAAPHDCYRCAGDDSWCVIAV